MGQIICFLHKKVQHPKLFLLEGRGAKTDFDAEKALIFERWVKLL